MDLNHQSHCLRSTLFATSVNVLVRGALYYYYYYYHYYKCQDFSDAITTLAGAL